VGFKLILLSKMSLNPNAKPFSFNPNAKAFVFGQTPNIVPLKKEATPAAKPPANAPATDATAVAAPAPVAAAPAAAPAAEAKKEAPANWDEEDNVGKLAEKVAQTKIEDEEPPPTAEELAEIAEIEKEEREAKAAAEKVEPSAKKKKDTKTFKVHDEREHLNIVFIGHVDAGKSTISGQLLLQTGQVDERTIAKYEKEAKEKNRDSWYLAFIMDTNEEERNKGKTVEVGRAHFATTKKRYTLLDAPGHKNYVPNMIEGTAQADVGVLVISARKGEFETGFDRGGQTREHAMLAKTLGITRLIVLVNKMDESTVNWSQERFKQVEDKLSPFLKQWGYKVEEEVTFVPCSGYTGAGLLNDVDPGLCSWYKGRSLINTLDDLKPINRAKDLPLRLPVIARYKEMGSLVIIGKIEQGSISVGQKLELQPSGKTFSCVGIQIEETDVDMASTGENVCVKVKGLEEEEVQQGFVMSGAGEACGTCCHFEAQVVVLEMLEHKPLLTAGYEAVMHAHTVSSECTVSKLLAAVDKKTGKKAAGRPRFLKTGAVGIVRISMAESVAVENFKTCPQLGRFTLRDEGRTVAIGKILKLNQLKPKA